MQRTMSPTVMVLPTGPAETITRKSELSFVDLLRPCADVDTSGVAVNTTREQPYRVPQLTVRFAEAHPCHPTQPETARAGVCLLQRAGV